MSLGEQGMRYYVVKSVSGFFYLKNGDDLLEAKARGILKHAGVSPVAGDWVDAETEKSQCVISSVYPRKNYFVRPPMANIDKLLIVSSQSSPRPNALLIDRMIAIAERKKITPILIFNKADLGNFDPELLNAYKNARIQYYVLSSIEESDDLDAIRAEMDKKVCAFVGNSGVGKSTLLNRLIGRNLQLTGEVSEKLGRGRHTTRQVEMIPLANGGYIADTPGFSTIDMQAYETLYKEDLPHLFREFEPFLGNCRFSTCTHTNEPGCAVLDAVKKGIIAKSRHESYVAMFEEVKDLQPWQVKANK